MKITIKHLGVTHSVETEQEHLTATETLDIFCNLMRAVGYQEESINRAKEI
jgi:hypothetical protein